MPQGPERTRRPAGGPRRDHKPRGSGGHDPPMKGWWRLTHGAPPAGATALPLTCAHRLDARHRSTPPRAARVRRHGQPPEDGPGAVGPTEMKATKQRWTDALYAYQADTAMTPRRYPGAGRRPRPPRARRARKGEERAKKTETTRTTQRSSLRSVGTENTGNYL